MASQRPEPQQGNLGMEAESKAFFIFWFFFGMLSNGQPAARTAARQFGNGSRIQGFFYFLVFFWHAQQWPASGPDRSKAIWEWKPNPRLFLFFGFFLACSAMASQRPGPQQGNLGMEAESK